MNNVVLLLSSCTKLVLGLVCAGWLINFFLYALLVSAVTKSIGGIVHVGNSGIVCVGLGSVSGFGSVRNGVNVIVPRVPCLVRRVYHCLSQPLYHRNFQSGMM